MKTPIRILWFLLLLPFLGTRAATLYVDAGSTNAVAPYATLATAARDIQTAVNAAVAGDTVLVADGVYDTGYTSVLGQRCRVSITKEITLRSLGGALACRIVGEAHRQGTPEAVRCLHATAGVVEGFLLTRGTGYVSITGAGASLSGTALLRDCVIFDNDAGGGYGGGVHGGRLHNCWLVGNRASSGGAAYTSRPVNCLALGNTAGSAGAFYSCAITNCTVRFNAATSGSGGGADSGSAVNSVFWDNTSTFSGSNTTSMTMTYSCAGGFLASGAGNLNVNPRFAGLSSLDAVLSPCRAAGSPAHSFRFDLDGDAWANPPAMGCDQPVEGAPPAVRLIAPARIRVDEPGRVFAHFNRQPDSLSVDFGDGSRSDGWLVSHRWRSPGLYPVVVRALAAGMANPVSATQMVEVVVVPAPIHVSAETGNDANNGLSWATAKKTIQAGISAQTALFGVVLVTNGVYNTGVSSDSANHPCRVVATKPVVIRSVNGPLETRIVGNPATHGTTQAVRLAYLLNAVLDGFLLDQGNVTSSSTTAGGVNMSGYGLLRNCIVMNCRGGTYGGAVYQGTVENCRIYGNSSTSQGGGAYGSVVLNSLLVGNVSGTGGGLHGGSATNCTLRFNTATGTTGAGGAVQTRLVNCLLGGNRLGAGVVDSFGSTLVRSVEGLAGTSLALDHHLAPDSPHASFGLANSASGPDLDGDAWSNPPAAGCDQPSAPSGPAGVRLAAPLTLYERQQGVVLAIPSARPDSVAFDFGDGATASGADHAFHAWDAAGVYTARVTCVLAGETTPRVSEQVITILPNTLYVSADAGDDLNDGTSWARAKRTIQAAVNAITRLGGQVVVTNGTYDTGGSSATTDSVFTRVVASGDKIIRSVNGPDVTRIVGSPHIHLQPNAVRCAHLQDAVLEGFTLTGGGLPSSSRNGGGALLTGTARLRNCVVLENRSGNYGGGVYGGAAENCRFVRNQAAYGGGAALSTLRGSLLVWNEATQDGGGANGGTLVNCTVRHNSAVRFGGGVSSSALYNSILWQNTGTTANSNVYGVTTAFVNINEGGFLPGANGNLSTNPQLSADHRIAPGSPAHRAGSSSMVSGVDLDGDAWASPLPSIGCDEPAEAAPGAPILSLLAPERLYLGQAALFNARASQPASAIRLDLGDGTVEPATGYRLHTYGATGVFQVVATAFTAAYPGGVAVTQRVEVLPNAYYVSAQAGNDANDGLSWAFPKRTIQAAVNASRPFATIRVADGIYDTGSAPSLSSYALPARVCAPHPLFIRSVNGPFATTILGMQGAGETANAVRCAYLQDTLLEGFTLQHGCTQSVYDPGGGAYLSGASALLRNCVVLENQVGTFAPGGGVFGGAAENCLILSNSAQTGGGSASTGLRNCLLHGNRSTSYGGGLNAGSATHCTVTGNSSGTGYGGGAYNATLLSSIVWGNTGAGTYSNVLSFTASYSTLGTATPVSGNSNENPRFSGLWHLGATSPCVGAGQPGGASGLDLDGEPWRSPPSRGCDESPLSSPAGDVPSVAAPSRVLVRKNGLVLARVSPAASSFQMDFGDGASASNQEHALHAWALPGFYNVVVTAFGPGFEAGLSATQRVEVVDTTIYVSAETGNDDWDGRTWATAKRTLQAGVSAQLVIDADVVVTNGVYAAGGYLAAGQITPARVNVERRLNVRSVNGPAHTRVIGAPYAQGTTNAMRCLRMLAGTFDGFTLEHGSTLNSSEDGGGAVLSTGAILRNCVLRLNTAGSRGGAFAGVAVVENCLFTENSAGNGGATYRGTLRNCAVIGNRATYDGGGLYQTSAYNTTVRGNSSGSSSSGGGASGGNLVNCIVWGNLSGSTFTQYQGTTFSYSCVQGSVPAGVGNRNVDPLFSGPFRLGVGSPCAAAGLPAYASGLDLDGTPWSSPPAMGCDQPVVPDGEPSLVIRMPTRLPTGLTTPVQLVCSSPHDNVRVSFGDGQTEARDAASWFFHVWREPGVHTVVAEVSGGSLPSPLLATQIVEVVESRVFVSANAGDDANDGRSWSTAKRTIQGGVDAQNQVEGLVLVAEGHYEEGIRTRAADSLPTRLVVEKPVTIIAPAGPFRTRIVGAPFRQGTPAAVRCVYLGMGALEGFSLLGGCTSSSANDRAGGVHMGGSFASILGCIVMDNQSGGVRGGVARDSLILRNGSSGAYAGGAYTSDLVNCLVAHNQGSVAGGVYQGTITNCSVRLNLGVGFYYGSGVGSIVWDNAGSGTSSNVNNAVMQYSDIGASSVSGAGNLKLPPRFESLLRLAPDSPCLGAGKPGLPVPLDWEGDPRPPLPAMGCDEPLPANHSPLVHAPLRIGTGVPGTVLVIVPPGTTRLAVGYGDGTPPGDAEITTHKWFEPGNFQVVATAYTSAFPGGVSATQTVSVVDNRIYVSTAGSDGNPGRSWAEAKRTIQAGVDAQTDAHGLVLVDDGVYDTGVVAVPGSTPLRVKAASVQLLSRNGAARTRIVGVPHAANTPDAVRCVQLVDATLDGFTVEHGSCTSSGQNGGGVLADARSRILNCVLHGNRAGNGGAVSGGTLENCLLIDNRADANGGGAHGSTVVNCAVLGNTATLGGGLYNCSAVHSTIRLNSASGDGGGCHTGSSVNGIVWENLSLLTSSSNVYNTVLSGTDAGDLLVSGSGNRSVPPLFDGLFRLSPQSPCLGGGLPGQAVGADVDGDPRPSPPAMGCDEPFPGVAARLIDPLETAGTGQRVSFLLLPAPGATRALMDFGDGSAPSEGFLQSHAWERPGLHTVTIDLLPSNQRFTREILILDNRVYVDALRGNDSWDGLTPASAKRTLQAGVDAQTVQQGMVVVAPGLYAEGSRASPVTHSLPARVVATRAVLIKSTHGPFETFLRGAAHTHFTSSALRGAYLVDSILDGFTLEDFSTQSGADSGAGAYLVGASALRNCLLWNNRAGVSGGGAYGGSLHNCMLVNNQATNGGAAHSSNGSGLVALQNQAESGGAFYNCDLTNSTIRLNLASSGAGGVHWGSLLNCISWNNRRGATTSNSISTRARYSNLGGGILAGPGNTSVNPQITDTHHLPSSSPALGAGLAGAVPGLDWDGDRWSAPLPMGADAPAGPRPLVVRLLVGSGPRTYSGTPILVLANQWTSGIEVDFGDGTSASGQAFFSHDFPAPGEYDVVARVFHPSLSGGMAVTQRVAVIEGSVHVSARIGLDANDGRTWLTAKRTIQAGVDAQSLPNGRVLVSEGVYNFGSTTVSSLADNQPTRVVVSRPLSVIAVDGPGATRIQGLPGAQGTAAAVRGAYLKDATLEGFTIEHGAGINATNDGGGVYMEGSARLRNCVVALNRAGDWGGGVYGGTAENCWFAGNAAIRGGAAYASRLLNCAVLYNQASATGGGLYNSFATNCTVRFNSANLAGGVYGGTLLNAIVWNNTAASSSNQSTAVSTYGCVGGTILTGTGNRNTNPRFFSLIGLLPTSPCFATGRAASGTGVDLDGDAWRSTPSMGCDEPVFPAPDDPPFLRMIAPSIAEPGVTAPLLFTCSHPTTSLSVDFGDGAAQASDGYATHAWSQPGFYLVTVTATVSGFAAPVVLQQPVLVQDDTLRVSATTGLDTQDGRSWATAKQTLQSAVDAQLRVGGIVLATNGVYNTGSRASGAGEPVNRVMVSRDILVRSVNGPAVTVIEGAPTSPAVGNGAGAVRPVYLGAGRLEGFTLRGGFTTATTTGGQNGRGGGAWLAAAAVLDSCVVTNNTAHLEGGGVHGGTVRNCLLAGNFAPTGAGACTSVVSRCTVVANTASSAGGGVSGGVIDNSVVFGNLAPLDPDLAVSTATFTCSPGLAGSGNLDATPLFVAPAAFNFRLRPDSPGLDLASPVGAPALDLDRLPRQVGPAPDLGAYEYAAATSDSDLDGMADGWETTHALDLFNPADAQQNPDGDAHSNLQEFIAGSLPRDASSQFHLQAEPAEPGLSPFLTVQALAGRAYTLEYRDSLTSGAWQTVPGLGLVRPTVDGPLTFTDPTPLPARLYRVRVEH